MGRQQTTVKPVKGETKAFTDTASNSTAAPDGVMQVRVKPDQDCYIDFDGTADSDSIELSAGQVEYFSINGGEVFSIVRKTTNGNINISYGTQ